jgi:Nucleoside-diphosphate-sugar epimerases
MSSILITGASGFIGRHLVAALRVAGHEVVRIDRRAGDVAEESTWSAYPATDVVVHLAGRSSVPDSWADAAAFMKTNLLGTVGALNYCKHHRARLVFLSSYMYGNPSALPIRETAPVVANNPYALSKKLAEETCRFYSERCGVDVVILRVFNVYGPGQADTFVVPYVVRQVRKGQAIRVKDLEPRRDYVYVTDVVEAIVKAVESPQRFTVLNIGSGVSYSVAELIQTIQDANESNLPVHSAGERRNDEIMNTVADISAAKQQLNWAPRWTLAQGVRQMLAAADTCNSGRRI